jgi:hypothetical protein
MSGDTGTPDDFFRNVNKTALARLDDWVPDLLPIAVKQATSAWRVSSEDLKRSYQEDLSIHPSGIQDFGPERGLTPIDVVIQYGSGIAASTVDAALWLCKELGIDPVIMGWRSNGREHHHDRYQNINAGDYPEPSPLPDRLLPVAPFDFDMMPDAVRPWAVDAAERMQAPPDFAAIAIMTGLGSLIGLKVGIRPKVNDDWTEFPNLWGMGVGTPGIMKSPSFSEGLRPVKLLAAAAREAHKEARARYEIDLLSAKARSDHAKKAAAKLLAKNPKADIKNLLEEGTGTVEEPICRRYIATNATTAALGVILLQNPNGLLVDRDELLALLERLDDEGQSEDRGFYLVGWNGNLPYTFDRIVRGLDLHIESVCISMIGGTQPARISQYLEQIRRGTRNNDGMIQRFGLMVWPDISPEWKNIDRKPNLDARNSAFRVFKSLDGLDWRAIGAKRDRVNGEETGIPFLRLCSAAQQRFSAWHRDLEERLRSGTLDPMMESHLSKYRKLVPALALIIHLADATDAEGKLTRVADVTDVAVEKALKWSTYLETHAARTYASTTIASADAARAIIAKVRSGHLKREGFGSREILRSQWSLLKDRDTVHAALQLLVDHDWLFLTKVETAGRTATVYTPNPKILEGKS